MTIYEILELFDELKEKRQMEIEKFSSKIQEIDNELIDNQKESQHSKDLLQLDDYSDLLVTQKRLEEQKTILIEKKKELEETPVLSGKEFEQYKKEVYDSVEKAHKELFKEVQNIIETLDKPLKESLKLTESYTKAMRTLCNELSGIDMRMATFYDEYKGETLLPVLWLLNDREIFKVIEQEASK